MHVHVLERIHPGTRIAGPESIELPAGYAVEPVATNLNYPTAVSWDPDGNLLIAESRPTSAQGEATGIRILQRTSDGTLRPLVTGFDQPIADIAVHNGRLYVSHRGEISVIEHGHLRPLIRGLPSWGLHQNTAIAFDRAGRLYFGQGTVSNTGIVGPAELEQLYRTGRVYDHDIPGATVILSGSAVNSTNPITHTTRPTGPFSPWGTVPAPGALIHGATGGLAASGAVMVAGPDGSNLHVFAWGLRNPLGLAFAPDGRLYASNQGAKPLGPRPVPHDADTFWAVEEGSWYGWPDFYGGRPVTDPRFRVPEHPAHEFLLANRRELLRGRAAPPQPVAVLGEQVSAAKFDFCRHPDFGFVGQAFLAEFGPQAGPREGMGACPGGHRVVRIDPAGTVSDFAVNRSRMPASMAGNSGGLERPIAAKFGPDGNLYVVDLGVVEFREDLYDWYAPPRTGIVWRITHVG